MSVLQLANPAGRLRQMLFKVGVVSALALIPFVLFDVLFRRVFATFLARLDWPFSLLATLPLIFIFGDLLGELRGMTQPVEQLWTDQRHFAFVRIVCLILAFLLSIFYFVAVHEMVEPILVGSPG